MIGYVIRAYICWVATHPGGCIFSIGVFDTKKVYVRCTYNGSSFFKTVPRSSYTFQKEDARRIWGLGTGNRHEHVSHSEKTRQINY